MISSLQRFGVDANWLVLTWWRIYHNPLLLQNCKEGKAIFSLSLQCYKMQCAGREDHSDESDVQAFLTDNWLNANCNRPETLLGDGLKEAWAPKAFMQTEWEMYDPNCGFGKGYNYEWFHKKNMKTGNLLAHFESLYVERKWLDFLRILQRDGCSIESAALGSNYLHVVWYFNQ